MKKIIGLFILYMFLLLVPTLGNTQRNDAKTNLNRKFLRGDYEVKRCAEIEVTLAAGDGTFTTSTFSAFGYLQVYIICDDTGNAVYSGDHEPTTAGTVYLKNAAGDTIATITTSLTAEVNDMVLGTSAGGLVYLVDWSTGDPQPRTGLYFTGTGFGSTDGDKIKIGYCYDIN